MRKCAKIGPPRKEARERPGAEAEASPQGGNARLAAATNE